MKRVHATSLQGVVLLALLAALLPACAGLGGEEPAGEAGDTRVTLPVERFSASEDAEMVHFVGTVDDDLFIGVVAEEGGEGDPSTVAVYLCDGDDVSQWIRGEMMGEEAKLVDGHASADLTIAGDGVSGAVALDGGEPQSFTAEPAADGAGVYRAEWSQGGVDYHIDWVILNDGRQRGPLDGKGNDVVVVDPN